MSATPRDVHVIGPPFSGSTLLGNALNGHPAIAHVGEVSAIPQFGIGADDDRCHLCLALGRECPVWTGPTLKRLVGAGAAGAIDVLREAAGAPVLVDSSKWVSWLHASDPLRRLGDRPVQVLLCVRSPFAFVDSVCRRDGIEAWQGANLWRDIVFDALRTLGHLGLPVMTVRYEDFAFAPEPVLRRICRFLDIAFDPGMLRFWETPVHAVSGNAGAFVWYDGYVHRGLRADKGVWSEADAATAAGYATRGFGGWVDDKWRARQDDRIRREIAGTPLLSDLATLVGYDLTQP